MKAIFLSILVVGAASARRAPVGAVFAVTPPAATPCSVAKSSNKASSSHIGDFTALQVATISIPRGGVLGTPVTREHLVSALIAYFSVTGALLPAPAKGYDLYGWTPKPTIIPGSLLEFTSENIASACLGIAVMLYLSTFGSGSMDAPTIIAYGSLACGYVAYKHFLNDMFVKLGSPAGLGAFQAAVFAGYLFAVLGGKPKLDTSLLAKLFSIPPTVVGVLGCFDPDAAKKLVRITATFNSISEASFRWMCRMFALWGLASYSLIFGREAKSTAGWVALLHSVMCIDSWYVTKDAVAVGVPATTVGIVTVVAALIGLGLLMT
jgi:hypothetical protein